MYRNNDMQNQYTSSVRIGDTLYSFSAAIFTALDMRSGKVAWKARRVGEGNGISAEDRLYCIGEHGAVALIEPSLAEHKEISRFEVKRPHTSGPSWASRGNIWTFPAIANGRLYIRDQDVLYAFDISDRPPLSMRIGAPAGFPGSGAGTGDR